MRKIGLVELVMEYGTDKQKACVLAGKKWRIESQNALMKVLNSKFGVVDVIGKQYNMEFTLDEEFDVEKDIVDGRVSNGQGQVPLKYEQTFPIMVIEHLLNRIGNEPLTVIKWLVNLGIITDDTFQASKLRYSLSALEKESDKLVENKVIESGQEYLIDDYIKREIERLQKYFMGVIQKLVKAKIIKHQSYTMAKCEIPYLHEYFDEESGIYVREEAIQTKYIELSAPVVGAIAKLERKLQNSPKFRKLSLDEISRYRNKPIVKEYWKEHKKQLNLITNEIGERLYIVLSYEAHALFVRAGINPIINWLEKNNKEALAFYNSDEAKYFLENRIDFHGALNKYVVDLAEGRQDKFQKKSINEFGGKANIHKFEDNKYRVTQDLMIKGLYVEAYRKLQEYYGYSLFGDVRTGEFPHDGITQEKFNSTYVSSYKDNLITIQDVEEEATA
ncbi:hypothetical protein J2Z40_000882 [Cytobacillus eiseniae]|uniref:Uncharacterized protein n=1 Tax=Cytobacillus eiseniae TaxID=762947 RepID=A0ABS4RBP2_9BACI|nr:hypothetical protein [Cytobacillus eiseniae]MBP2240327.1 hypothetical protein [Cytobacillus eiseniae]